MKLVALALAMLAALLLMSREDEAVARPAAALSDGTRDAFVTYNFARAVALDDQGRVHVVWYEKQDTNGRVCYRRGSGGEWTPVQVLGEGQHPSLAVDGERVHVVWHRQDGENADVVYAASQNGGTTWKAPVPLTSTGACAHASLAASGSNLYVVFGSGRGGHTAIESRTSRDRGATWEPARVLTHGPVDSWVPSVAAEGRNVYLAWVDLRDDTEAEYFMRSADEGRTWGPETRITQHPACAWAPSVACRGNDVYLAWFDQRDAGITRFQAESELNAIMQMLGLPVEPVPSGIYQTTPPLNDHMRCQVKAEMIQKEAPAFVQRGGDVAALQSRMRELGALMSARPMPPLKAKERKLDEIMQLLGLKYEGGGTVTAYFDAPLQARLQSKLARIQQAAPAWVTGGGDPQKLDGMMKQFERHMKSAFEEWEIYFQRSRDGGRTWEPTQRLTRAPGLSHRPSLALDGDTLHIAWFDGREGPTQVYYKKSLDGGGTWSDDLALTHAQTDAQHPMVAATKGKACVIWHQAESGGRSRVYSLDL